MSFPWNFGPYQLATPVSNVPFVSVLLTVAQELNKKANRMINSKDDCMFKPLKSDFGYIV